jgi:hypothetical protein
MPAMRRGAQSHKEIRSRTRPHQPRTPPTTNHHPSEAEALCQKPRCASRPVSVCVVSWIELSCSDVSCTEVSCTEVSTIEDECTDESCCELSIVDVWASVELLSTALVLPVPWMSVMV